MKPKKPSHADNMPRVDIKVNVDVQFSAHRVISAIALILWILSAWPP